jgi:hypothetical protein
MMVVRCCTNERLLARSQAEGVRRAARTRRTAVSSSALTRWGGAAACLAALSYVAWGYLDDSEASAFVMGTLVPALSVATPALFLGGFVGLYSRLAAGGSTLRRIGLLVGMLGTVLGLVHELGWLESDWWPLLFVGLVVTGVSTIVEGASRRLGTLVLASGTLGVVSLLTDPAFPGVVVPARPAHVAFAALFCLSCVAWGWSLLRGTS